MKPYLRKQYIETALLACCIIASLFGARLLYKMVNTQINTTVEFNEKIASYSVNKKAFLEEVQLLESFDMRILSLEKYVVTEESLPRFLSLLEQTARASGARFDITNVDTKILTGETTARLMIEFSAKGERSAINRMLTSLTTEGSAIEFKELFLFSGIKEVALPTEGILSPPSVSRVRQSATPFIEWSALGKLEVVSF